MVKANAVCPLLVHRRKLKPECHDTGIILSASCVFVDKHFIGYCYHNSNDVTFFTLQYLAIQQTLWAILEAITLVKRRIQ